MFVAIWNAPMRYAWGADRAISELLGTDGVLDADPEGDDRIEAELWMGDHPSSPSRLADPAAADGAADLAEWIARDPERVLGRFADGLRRGDGPRLPFLLKVLAAGGPLSIQAHPSLDGARAGFAAEEAAGVPRDAPHRNYRDPSHKPELLLAVSPTMDALVGFRPPDDARRVVAALADAAAGDPALAAAVAPLARHIADADDEAGRHALVTWLLTPGAAVAALVDAIGRLAADPPEGPDAAAWRDGHAVERATIADLAERFPGDAGVALALLLNRVRLRRGEAVFVPAGVLHAYLAGTGIEIMAASDNVLRGGLTAKHVDRAELLGALDLSRTGVETFAPDEPAPGVRRFAPAVSDFRLVHVHGDGADARRIDVDGPAVVLVLRGEARLRGAASAAAVRAGESVFVTPDEGALDVSGDHDLVVAMPGLARDVAAPVAADHA